MRLGYNSNGFAHHRLEDALTILAELGYQSVALTLDHFVLNPFQPELPWRVERTRRLLERLRLRCVVETGARFLLDPRHKHQPTLISPTAEERQKRLDFLSQAVVIAHDLGADAVSFWSGAAVDDAPSEVLDARLLAGCRALLGVAGEHRVRLAFEPEPGMFIDTQAAFARLDKQIGDPLFGLTMDLGHVHCQGESIREELRRGADRLFNVHIEDMRRGVHEHLMFGDGEIDFVPVLRTLKEIGYTGGVHVELSRHSHDAVNTARNALAFLRDKLAQ
jgi:L-ribulose-5-phosphate 3-epimerase